MKINKLFLASLFLALVSLERIEVLLLTDIHLDLLYKSSASAENLCRDSSQKADQEAPLGRYGCDSPLALLEQVLDYASKNVQPKYVLINGDTVAHEMAQDHGVETVMETHRIVFTQVSRFFPQAIILPSIGNNDLLIHNNVPKKSEARVFYSFLYGLWFGPLSKAQRNKKELISEEVKNLKRGGFYSVQIADNLTLLVINSIFYMIENLKSNDPEGAQLQMEWIESTLENAPDGMKFILFYHVNVGADAEAQMQWHQEYEDQFLEIQKKYQDRIEMDWVAHIHRATIRGYEDATTGDVYGLGVHSPAVTPYSLSNPSFRVYTLESQNKATKLRSYRDYALQLELVTSLKRVIPSYLYNRSLVWKTQYTNEFLGISDFTPREIKQYWLHVIDDPAELDDFVLQSGGYDKSMLAQVKSNYSTYYGVHFPTSTENNWQFYCKMMCPGKKNFAKCVKNPPSS